MLVGNGHTWLIGCGSVARLLPARPACGTQRRGRGRGLPRAGRKTRAGRGGLAFHACGRPRRRRSQDNVGEPVPVRRTGTLCRYQPAPGGPARWHT